MNYLIDAELVNATIQAIAANPSPNVPVGRMVAIIDGLRTMKPAPEPEPKPVTPPAEGKTAGEEFVGE